MRPEYVTYVLNENFEDAKALFLSPLMAIHYAHLVMLADAGHRLAPTTRARSATRSTASRTTRSATSTYDGTYEDLFFYIERLIVEACGEDVAGRLHTARSRNDIDMTMYRMRQREFILGLLDATLDAARGRCSTLADRHRDTIFAAHTHTQPAQPTTVAHYLLAVIEQLERDAVAAAGGATSAPTAIRSAPARSPAPGFPIDRAADRASCSASTGRPATPTAASPRSTTCSRACRRLRVLLVGLGRFVQDLLLWCTAEFGYLRLGDGFVQCSSIMPQKRNPVALEHARAIGSKALGQAQAIVTDRPQHAVRRHRRHRGRPAAARGRDVPRRDARGDAGGRGDATAEFDAARLEARAGDGGTTLTELADTLVRDHGLPFRTAHAIAGAADRRRGSATPTGRLRTLLADVSTRVARARRSPTRKRSCAQILSPRHFVERAHARSAARRRRRPRAPPASRAAARRRRRVVDAARPTRWRTRSSRSPNAAPRCDVRRTASVNAR